MVLRAHCSNKNVRMTHIRHSAITENDIRTETKRRREDGDRTKGTAMSEDKVDNIFEIAYWDCHLFQNRYKMKSITYSHNNHTSVITPPHTTHIHTTKHTLHNTSQYLHAYTRLT